MCTVLPTVLSGCVTLVVGAWIVSAASGGAAWWLSTWWLVFFGCRVALKFSWSCFDCCQGCIVSWQWFDVCTCFWCDSDIACIVVVSGACVVFWLKRTFVAFLVIGVFWPIRTFWIWSWMVVQIGHLVLKWFLWLFQNVRFSRNFRLVPKCPFWTEILRYVIIFENRV